MKKDQRAISERAYKLWKKAGEPKGKEDQFRYEAERQFSEERIRHELETPDTL
jgi:hypothetical protein